MPQHALRLVALIMLLAGSAHAAPPRGYTIPEITLSPDRRLGVLVPDMKRYDAGGTNKLVEIATGRVLAEIKAEPGMERMNHGGVLPTRWSADSSLLLWHVDGKWFPRALVLIKLKGKNVQWQLDLLKSAQQEILARTRKAAPEKYAAAKEANAGNGSAYPDGFTVDVKIASGDDESPLALPLRLAVTLTSDPKAIEDYPAAGKLDANLEAEVSADGKFNVLNFALE